MLLTQEKSTALSISAEPDLTFISNRNNFKQNTTKANPSLVVNSARDIYFQTGNHPTDKRAGLNGLVIFQDGRVQIPRGSLYVDHAAHIAGDIHLGAGKTIFSQGRLHIMGPEHLYVLNKTGMTVSQAWQGYGSLTVEGDQAVHGNATFRSNARIKGELRVDGQMLGNTGQFTSPNGQQVLRLGTRGDSVLDVDFSLNKRGISIHANNPTHQPSLMEGWAHAPS